MKLQTAMMVWCFMAHSTLFESYPDYGRPIIKDCVMKCCIVMSQILPLVGIKPRYCDPSRESHTDASHTVMSKYGI